MTKIFKTVLLATAATAATAMIAAGPASARTRHVMPRAEATQNYMPSAVFSGAYYNDPYVVTDGARYLGRVPDAQIRSQILKDESTYKGNY